MVANLFHRRDTVNRVPTHLIVLMLVITFSMGCSTAEPDPIAAVPAPYQLITVDYQPAPNATISTVDITSGELSPIWSIPAQGWVNQVSLLDADTLGLSYTPEPNAADGIGNYDRAGIYTLDLKNATASLVPVLVPDVANTYFYNPLWTHDGRYLFYVRYLADPTGDSPPDVTLMRHEFATASQIEMAKDGIWPRISAESRLITYIIVDPATQNRGLLVSDWDGNNVTQLVETGEYYDIDTPLFSADGAHIYFTASLAGRKISWLDWLTGVKTAFAHADRNVPVEWFRVSVDGGTHEQLSAEKQAIIYGVLDSVGERLYFATLDGLFTMPSAGGAFTAVNSSPTFRTMTTR